MGTPKIGSTLSCSTGSWAGNPNIYAYAWLRDGSQIAGQDTSTYVVQSADWGRSLSCEVTAANSGGEYVLGGLASGAYRVQFDSGEANYVSQYFSGQLSTWMATPVSVTAPAMTSGVNGVLSVGGEITGTVLAADSGAPVVHIRVCADDPEVDSGCAWTTSAGQYTIMGLRSGSYHVEFEQRHVWSGESRTYLMQYYPGKASQQEAELVGVTEGAVTPGVDASMQLGGRITGRVTAAVGGAVIMNVEVCAHQESGEPGPGQCATTDESGEYKITGLASGSYQLGFTPPNGHDQSEAQADNYLPQYYNSKTSWNEADAVNVTAGSTTSGIDAALQTGGEITGHVTAASTGAPLEGIEVCAESSRGCTTTDATGGYTLSGFPTSIQRVKFKAPESANYLTQYYNGKPLYWETDFVSVTAGQTAAGIDAAMEPGGQITGTVTDAVTQQPLAGVSVCASWREPTCTRTGASGQYTLSSLASGSYRVEFHAYGVGNHLAQSKPEVSVIAGSTTSGVDVALPPGGQISGRVTAGTTGLGIAGILVCAREIGPGWESWGCGATNSPGGSASATSNAIAVPTPTSSFTLKRHVSFDAKTGELDFFFKLGNPGMFGWSLFFKNADVGFADTLDISHDQRNTTVIAGAARRACKKGLVKHKRKCVRVLVLLASGSQAVPTAGIVEIKVRASAKALRALKTGHTLHVSGSFTFQSSLGGPPASRRESVAIRLPRRYRHAHR
jgi:hypothetical protein